MLGLNKNKQQRVMLWKIEMAHKLLGIIIVTCEHEEGRVLRRNR